jgi:uncharacterized protein (DUF983 family)
MVRRALVRRCPRCGAHGAWFTGWFRRLDRCPSCGYRYEREEGFMVGAITMSTILTFGVILVVLVAGMILTYPEIATVPIVIGCVAAAIVVPIVAFPITHTLWAAIDLAMHPLTSKEAADAAAAVARTAASSPTGSPEHPGSGEDA